MAQTLSLEELRTSMLICTALCEQWLNREMTLRAYNSQEESMSPPHWHVVSNTNLAFLKASFLNAFCASSTGERLRITFRMIGLTVSDRVTEYYVKSCIKAAEPNKRKQLKALLAQHPELCLLIVIQHIYANKVL